MSQRKPAAMTAPASTRRGPAMITGRRIVAPAQVLSAAQQKALENPVIARIFARKAFFESPAFNRLIGVFAKAVQKEDMIDQDNVTYARPGRYKFTADEMRDVVEAVMEHAPSETRQASPDGFHRLSKTYKALDFTVLIGQGSVYQIFAAGKEPKP